MKVTGRVMDWQKASRSRRHSRCRPPSPVGGWAASDGFGGSSGAPSRSASCESGPTADSIVQMGPRLSVPAMPSPRRPGYGGQQHQTYPTQAGGLDEMTATGAHRVAIYSLGLDLPATSSLQSLIYPQPLDHHPDPDALPKATAAHGSVGAAATQRDRERGGTEQSRGRC